MPYYTEGMKRQSNKNGIARVTVRTKNHNVGSHVLSRMVDAEAIRVEKIVSDENLYYTSIREVSKGQKKRERLNKIHAQVTSYYDNNLDRSQTLNSDIDPVTNKLLLERTIAILYSELLSKLISYVKTRDQLIDDLVTATPQMQNSKWFVRQVLTEFDSNSLILNRISGTAKFNYKFNLQGLISGNSKKEGKYDIDDIQVAISNDMMGQHCIYIILENIIRNTAKHGSTDIKQYGDDPDVIFTIHIGESTTDSSYYRVTVYDNIKIKGKSILKIRRNSSKRLSHNQDIQDDIKGHIIELKEEDQISAYLESTNKKVYIKSQKDNNEVIYDYYEINNIDYLVIKQNIWINKPILDLDTFDLRKRALGLIEMEVCTAYLRGIPVEEIESSKYVLEFAPDEIKRGAESTKRGEAPLRLLRAVRAEYDKEKETGCLGYCFYLPKPKELLIIDNIGTLWHSVKGIGTKENPYKGFNELENNGILLLNNDNDKSEINNKWIYKPQEIYKHTILLIIGKNDNLRYYKLPKRRVSYEATQSNFASYFEKFKSELKDFVQYDISLDIISDSRAFIREVWRSYITARMLEEGIQKFEHSGNYSGYNDLFPNLARGISYAIDYDVHGAAYNQWAGKFYAIIESRYENQKKQLDAFPYCEDGSRIIGQFKGIDAALTNIAVIDERIQELSQNEYKLQNENQTLAYQEIWNYMNVYIPTVDEIPLGIQTFNTNYEQRIIDLIKDQFDEHSPRQKSGIDFVIIHLGILEKILNVQVGKSKDRPEDLINLINNIANTLKTEIILTSGRAQTNLPNNISFLGYSLISQYLIENRFKLYLSEIIYASRPKT